MRGFQGAEMDGGRTCVDAVHRRILEMTGQVKNPSKQSKKSVKESVSRRLDIPRVPPSPTPSSSSMNSSASSVSTGSSGVSSSNGGDSGSASSSRKNSLVP